VYMVYAIAMRAIIPESVRIRRRLRCLPPDVSYYHADGSSFFHSLRTGEIHVSAILRTATCFWMYLLPNTTGRSVAMCSPRARLQVPCSQ
jgi:hypothetical protein